MSPLTERYYLTWQTERLVDGLERYLAGHADLEIAQLVEVLLVDQALEWQNGAGPIAEQYVGRFPILADHRHAIMELVYGEMRAICGLGLRIDVDAYAGRFPYLAAPLRRQAEVLEWLEEDVSDVSENPPPP